MALALVDGGVGGAGRDAGSVGVPPGPHTPDQLPSLVVSLDHHLDLCVEVAVGQADHQALLSIGFYFITEFYRTFFFSILFIFIIFQSR